MSRDHFQPITSRSADQLSSADSTNPSSRHKQALYKAKGRGQKFSGHVDIKVTINVKNLGASDPQGEIAGGR